MLELEQKYRFLFEKTHDAVFISTPEGKILDMNPAGVAMYGFDSIEEMRQISSARELYLIPEDRDTFTRALSERGYVQDMSLNMRKRGGAEIAILVTASAVRDEQGRITAYQGIMRDVTAQRQLEKELLQAQRLEAAGLLAKGAAHDFNNYLSQIIGYAELMMVNRNEPDPLYAKIKSIRTAGMKMADLLRQVVGFHRRKSLFPMKLRPSDIFSESFRALVRQIGPHIRVRIDLAPDLGSVYADPALLEQAIMNLVANAAEAMPEGGLLTIKGRNARPDRSERPETGPGDYVKLSVIDTGKGMDRETLRRAFEPFFTTKPEGSGLGLAVAHRVVKQHHGFIEASGEPGRGSRFDIYLPAAEEGD